MTFSEYDSNGAFVWNKALAGNTLNLWNGGPAFTMINDGADGFRFARLAGISVTSNTYSDSIQIVHVNGNGVVIDAFAVRKVFSTDLDLVPFGLDGLDSERTPDGGMVLALTRPYFAGGTIDIMKIGPGGIVEWSQCVGYGLGAGPMPTASFDLEVQARVAVSPAGRIYYTEASEYPYSALRLAELDSNGEMLWMKRYIYGNTSPSISFNDIQMDGAGNIHAAGGMTSSVGHFHIFLRTDADGVLDRGDIYRTPLTLMKSRLGIDAEGRRYHLVNTLNSMNSTFSHGILIADTLGSPAQFIRRDDQVDLPNNVFLVPYAMDVNGGQLAISGLLNHEDVNLAYTTRYETLSSIGTDSLFSCLMDDTIYANIPVPLSIMTTEDISNAASIDVSTYYSTEPLALSFTSIAPDPLDMLCTFAGMLLQTELGLEEDSSTALAVPLVLNSLLAQGTPLVLNDTEAKAVDVYNIHGALVQRSPVGADRTVSTTGWPTGCI